jgi:hypothetical protein
MMRWRDFPPKPIKIGNFLGEMVAIGWDFRLPGGLVRQARYGCSVYQLGNIASRRPA